MAAPTDLTWFQFATAADGNYIQQMNFSADPTGNPDLRYFIDPSEILGVPLKDIQQAGVILVLNRLLEIARLAQAKLNQGKPAGQKLAAFPAPTVAAPANGYVPITRSLALKAELASATQIVGTTA